MAHLSGGAKLDALRCGGLRDTLGHTNSETHRADRADRAGCFLVGESHVLVLCLEEAVVSRTVGDVPMTLRARGLFMLNVPSRAAGRTLERS